MVCADIAIEGMLIGDADRPEAGPYRVERT